MYKQIVIEFVSINPPIKLSIHTIHVLVHFSCLSFMKLNPNRVIYKNRIKQLIY